MASSAPFTVRQQNGVTIYNLGKDHENLDETLLDRLRDPLLQAVERAQPPLVIIDLSEVKFFGSSFIELLFRLANRVKARGGTLALSGLTSYCAEVLSITHLDQLWPSYADCNEAVQALQAQPHT